MTFAAVICDADDPCSVLTFVSCHAGIFSSFSVFALLLPLHLDFFYASGIGMNFVHKTVMSHRIRPFCSDVILMRFVSSFFWSWSRAFVGINNTGICVLRFPTLRWVSPLLFIGILQNIAAGIGTSNFLRAAFIVCLNSSSFGSIKNIPLNCLALSRFGFSIAHLCFAFFCAASDICFHISGHTLSGVKVVCFLVSLSRQCVSCRWPFLQRKKSCDACPCI